MGTADLSSVESQIERLKLLGLLIPDESKAVAFLTKVNYFRAAGYFRYFQVDPKNSINRFERGANFDEIVEVYNLDLLLRQQLLLGLSIYEVAFKAQFVRQSVRVQGSTAYAISPSYLPLVKTTANGQIDLRNALMSNLYRDLKQSRERFVSRHDLQHSFPPVWAAIETFTMGTISKMFELSVDDVRYPLARTFELPNPEFATSQLRSFTVLRNHCAHQARIWNRVVEFPPKVLKKLKVEEDQSIYQTTPWSQIVSLAHQVDLIQQNQDFSAEMSELVNKNQKFLKGLKHPHQI